jgi:hypothetical protein
MMATRMMWPQLDAAMRHDDDYDETPLCGTLMNVTVPIF